MAGGEPADHAKSPGFGSPEAEVLAAERSQRPMAGKTHAQGSRLDTARHIHWQRLAPRSVQAPPRLATLVGRGRRILKLYPHLLA